MGVEDIMSFFTTSSREENDASNKIRESVLKIISNPPLEYLENNDYSKYWKIVYEEWNSVINAILINHNINTNNVKTKVIMKGGRNCNYDVELLCYHDEEHFNTFKLEFKNGGLDLTDLPQILSLQAKFKLIDESYDRFLYDFFKSYGKLS
jgi:hypothetical protein